MKKGLCFRRYFLAVAGALLVLVTTSCSSLFYYPDGFLHAPPARLGLDPPEEIWFNASDGTKLFGWWFKAATDSPKGTIVQFHGNGENLSSHYVSLVWLIRQGYNLFSFDYRGYGKSEGKPNHKGTHRDGLAALKKAWDLHSRHPSPGLFVVYGQSIGGVIGFRSAHDSELADSIDLMVLDSSFSSYKRIAKEKTQEFWLTWIFTPLVGFFVSDEYAAEKVLSERRPPLLIIHNKSDPIIPIEFGEDLFKKSQAHTVMWRIETPGHVDIFEKPEWRDEFVRFLDRVAKGRQR